MPRLDLHLRAACLTAAALLAACQPSSRPATSARPATTAATVAPLPKTAPTTVPTEVPTATLAPTPTEEPTPEPTAAPTQAPQPALAPLPLPPAPLAPGLAAARAAAAGSAGSCPPDVAPGLPAASSAPRLAPGQEGVLRPVLVQIDNAVPARPPLHLSAASTVYEYVAEGGVTRFTAMFNQDDVGIVGPVRSARLISLELARQFDALLVYHGASIGVQDHIWNGGIYFVSFNAPDAFAVGSRLPGRVIPHNSITTLPEVRKYAQAHVVPLRVSWWPDFPRGDAPPKEAGTPTVRVSVGFAGPDGAPWPDYRADYQYEPEQNRYVRSIGGRPHVDGLTGEQLGAETVVVQVAPVLVTDIVEDIYGSLSLDYQLQGEGTAYFLRDGYRWQGCWRRPGAFEPTTFYGPDGQPFPFGRGTVWVSEAAPNTPLAWAAS